MTKLFEQPEGLALPSGTYGGATPSTPSTPPLEGNPGGVEGVAGGITKPGELPEFAWEKSANPAVVCESLGNLLSSVVPSLYRAASGGLLRIKAGIAVPITQPGELAAFLNDHVWIRLTKDGKPCGSRPSNTALGDVLASEFFLRNFPTVHAVVPGSVALADFTPSRPGFNTPDGVLHLGPATEPAPGIATIEQFLNCMDFAGNADRTNAVAAALTVLLRRHFPGGKPSVLITGTRSHCGKGTAVKFIQGCTPTAEIQFQGTDWPMKHDLHEQLRQKPDIGIINFDNVRTDSAGKAKLIRSELFESFITNSEVVLNSATARCPGLRCRNNFVVMLNTNEGRLSADFLNRSLPIHLAPQLDLAEKIARAKGSLGGDLKLQWLPAHSRQIEAEFWGMICRWIKQGKPLDLSTHHPMGPWAQVVGGIVSANGFTDFLGNYNATKVTADPISEALGILAFHASGTPRRAEGLVPIVLQHGLAQDLLLGGYRNCVSALGRELGKLLTRRIGHTLVHRSETHEIRYLLTKPNRRWTPGDDPHCRYEFTECGCEPLPAA